MEEHCEECHLNKRRKFEVCNKCEEIFSMCKCKCREHGESLCVGCGNPIVTIEEYEAYQKKEKWEKNLIKQGRYKWNGEDYEVKEKGEKGLTKEDFQTILGKLENISSEQEMSGNKDEYVDEWLRKLGKLKTDETGERLDTKDKRKKEFNPEKEMKRLQEMMGDKDTDEENIENIINTPEISSSQELETSEKVSEKEEIQNTQGVLTPTSNQIDQLLSRTTSSQTYQSLSRTTSQSSIFNLQNLFNMAANINEMKRMFENMYGFAANSLDAALPANQTMNAQFNQIAQGLEAVRATTGTVNIPYFYGRDDEDPEQWITQFNAAFTASGRAEGNNGVNKAALAAAHLQGNALDWYHMIK